MRKSFFFFFLYKKYLEEKNIVRSLLFTEFKHFNYFTWIYWFGDVIYLADLLNVRSPNRTRGNIDQHDSPSHAHTLTKKRKYDLL